MTNLNTITCIKPDGAVLGPCGLHAVSPTIPPHYPDFYSEHMIENLEAIPPERQEEIQAVLVDKIVTEVVKRDLELVVQPPYQPYKSVVNVKKHTKRQQKKLIKKLGDKLRLPFAMPINLFKTKVKKLKPFNRTDYGKVRKERILNNLLNNRHNIKPILVKENLWPKERGNGAKIYSTYISKRRLNAKKYRYGRERYCALDSYFKDYGNFDNLLLDPDDIEYAHRNYGVDDFHNCDILYSEYLNMELPKNGFTLRDCVVGHALPGLIKESGRKDILFKYCETKRPSIDSRVFKELKELNYHISDYVEITVNDYWRKYVTEPGETQIDYNGALIRVGCTYLTPEEIKLLTFKYFTPKEQAKYIALREKHFDKVHSLMVQI